MHLTLARVIACSNEGCRVQLLDDDSVTDAPLSPRMIEIGTRIRPGHIVALARTTMPPTIHWRFGGNTVEALAGDRATLLGRPFRLVDARPGDDRMTPIRVGDRVIVRSGRAEGELEVYDTIVDGRPRHPERLEAEFPHIEVAYRDLASA